MIRKRPVCPGSTDMEFLSSCPAAKLSRRIPYRGGDRALSTPMLALLFLSLAEGEPAPEEPLQENDTASDVVVPTTTPVVRKVGARPRIKKLVKATD